MKLLIVLLLAVSSYAQINLVKQWDALGGSGSEKNANLNIASNELGQVLITSDRAVTGYDSNGNQIFSTAIATFITNSGLTASTILDPRSTYNPFIQRWIVVCSCTSDHIMVSSGRDLTTATWKGVNMGVTTGDVTMYPGWNAVRTFISFFVTGSSPVRYKTTVIPSADLAWTGGGSPSVANKTVLDNMSYELRPCNNWDGAATTSTPMYFVSRDGPTQNGTDVSFNIQVESISGSTPTASAVTQIASPYLYNTPVDPSQPVGTMRGKESHRHMNCIQSSGHLYAIMGSGPQSGVDSGHNVVYFWDIATAGLTLAQNAKFSSSTLDYTFPNVMRDSSDNIIATMNGVSSGQKISIYGFYHMQSESAGTFHGPTLIKAGTQNYSCTISGSPYSWGTYAGAFLDAADATKMWFVGEYANSASDCAWGVNAFEATLTAAAPTIGSKLQGGNRFSGGTIR